MPHSSREIATLARYCITQSPGFAAIALWVPYFASDEAGFVAYTDGKQVVMGAPFWDFAPREQAFILCHEILHVALRHVPRGAFAKRRSRAHSQLWNIACDAVINHALGRMSWLQTPAEAVEMSDVLAPELLKNRPAATWSAEAIYEQLLSQFEAPNPAEIENQLQNWLDEHRFDAFDLRRATEVDASQSETGSDELASRIWASRLARAQAGDRPGGLLRALSNDFPTSSTPWPRVLRAFLQDATLPQSRENWNRPSRRTLSGASPLFEPGTAPESGIRRAGIVIDTSGSINDALLARFCAEIDAVQARTGCEIVLLCADSAVQSETIVRHDGRALLDKVRAGLIGFKGGGGTDFAPAIGRLNQLKVSVALYFTDLAGHFGSQKPSMPLLWCSTSAGQTAPFGRVVFLDAARRD